MYKHKYEFAAHLDVIAEVVDIATLAGMAAGGT